MRILHSPTEVAGQVGLSVHGLRALGHEARAYFPPHRFAYGVPPDITPRFRSRLGVHADALLRLPGFARHFDVFHFHFGLSFLPSPLRYADARLLARLGKTVVVEFWGSDVRMPSVELRRNPYFVNAYGESDERARLRMARWAAVTGGHAIVEDDYYEAYLRPYFPHIHVVRQRVDTRALVPAFPDPRAARPLVVHAPTQPAFKGTPHVRAAVERLRGEGLPFEYLELQNVSHADARAAYARADLVVDQVCAGTHGVLAAEVMSLGKPVVCYILPELVPTFPADFPVINANPETLAHVMREWLAPGAGERRMRRGMLGRAYAEREHDCRVVAARLVDVYRAMRGEAPAAAVRSPAA